MPMVGVYSPTSPGIGRAAQAEVLQDKDVTAGVDAGDHDAGLVGLGGAAHGRVNSDDDPIEARTGLHTAINQHVNDHRRVAPSADSRLH